jgi:hypothetical protein
MAASSSGSAEPVAVINQASGTFQITNSLDGQAIFQAGGLAPGRSVSGTVQLSNAGTLAGDLGLHQLDVVDQPGSNGGLLSAAVHLDVQDITGGNLVPVFAGQLASLQSSTLGKIAPGEARTYRFIASLPDGGPPPTPSSGDNAYAGSGLSVRYSWHATAPDEGGGGTGGGGSTGGGGNGEITPPKTSFRVISKKLVRRGWLDVLVTCNRACNVTARAQLAKVRHPRKKAVKLGRRSASLPLPNRTARIRLKLSHRSMARVRSALRTKPRISMRVDLSVIYSAWSKTQRYSTKLVVKRPKKRR